MDLLYENSCGNTMLFNDETDNIVFSARNDMLLENGLFEAILDIFYRKNTVRKESSSTKIIRLTMSPVNEVDTKFKITNEVSFFRIREGIRIVHRITINGSKYKLVTLGRRQSDNISISLHKDDSFVFRLRTGTGYIDRSHINDVFSIFGLKEIVNSVGW